MAFRRRLQSTKSNRERRAETKTHHPNYPYAATLFPYMQAVRFLTDYINGNTYYKIKYATHNLVRTRAQWKLFEEAEAHLDEMTLILAL